MAALLLLKFLMSLLFLHRAVECRILPRGNHQETFKPLCSRSCGYSSEKPVDEDFPLYHCSCSRSCSVFGDCCYDSPYRNTTNWHKASFVCLPVVGRDRYWAVSSCPPDHPSDFCQDSLGHLPPVTSKVTNITYANIFCASCNLDQAQLVTWNVKLRCPSEEDKNVEDSVDDTFRILYSSGDFWRVNEEDRSKRLCKFHVHYNDFRFLDGLELRPCTRIKKISKCSASWKDLSVMEKCRSYEDPIYFHSTVYKNSHCAECNYLDPKFSSCIPFYVQRILQIGSIDRKVTQFCKDRGREDCIRSLSEMHKGRRYAFADLLNINVKDCVPPPGQRCCRGKSFDFKTQRCREKIING